MSILQLVASGTLDLRLAGLLWLIMEHRASAIVAAGPSFAGKTTLLNCLLDFLPPSVQQVHLRGEDEDFRFLENAEPARTYMVAEEISPHLYEYVWGAVARKMFALLSEGYAFGATTHARSAEEVVYILARYLSIPLSALSRLGLVVTLRVGRARGYSSEPARQLDTVSLIGPGKGGLSIETLASRGPEGTTELAGDRALEAALASRFGLQGIVSEELHRREHFLDQLAAEGQVSCDEVKQAAAEYYEARKE